MPLAAPGHVSHPRVGPERELPQRGAVHGALSGGVEAQGIPEPSGDAARFGPGRVAARAHRAHEGHRVASGRPRVALLPGRHPGEHRTPGGQRGDEVHRVLQERFVVARARLEQEAPQRCIERQPVESPADRGDRRALEGAERAQLLARVVERVLPGRVEEAQRVHVVPRRRRAQHQRHQRLPMHLRRCPLGQLGALRPEAQGHAGPGASGATGALIGGVLRDGMERQMRPTAVIGRAPHQPGVDDHTDARHRQRGLRDVGGQDDLAAFRRPEHPGLLLQREPPVQRHDLERPPRKRPLDGRDLALARKEDQHVSGIVRDGVHGGDHALREPLRGRQRHPLGAVADGHRMEPPRRGQVRRVEVGGDLLGVEGRAHGDELRVGALPEQREEQVHVEAPLVELVQYHHVGGEDPLELPERDARRDEGEPGGVRDPRVVAHLVAHALAQGLALQLGDPRGQRAAGHPARLDDDHRVSPLEAPARHLGGLAGPGGRGDHQRPPRGEEGLPDGGDGQVAHRSSIADRGGPRRRSLETRQERSTGRASRHDRPHRSESPDES